MRLNIISSTSVLSLSLLLFAGISGSVLAVDQAQLTEDCKLEAIAVGLSKADLDEYIFECIEDFNDTELSTNIKLPQPQK